MDTTHLQITLHCFINNAFSWKCQLFRLSLPLTCEEEEYENHDRGVAKVKNGTGSSMDLKFGKEIMYSIDEEINCSKSTSEEWPPPPVIIL